MGRRPLPPKELTSVRLQDAVNEFMEYARAAAPDDSTSSPESKGVITRVMITVLGAGREVWTLCPGDFDDVMTSVINGASPAEAAERRANKQRPRTGRKAQSSVSQAQTIIRQFAAFCSRRRWLAYGITLEKEIIRSNKSNKTPEITARVRIPAKEFTRLLELADSRHARCRIALAIGLYCGRRVSEVVRLQWGDIDWEREEIRFYLKKAGKWHTVPLFPEIRYEIERWRKWAIRTGYGEPQDNWHLVANRRRPERVHNLPTVMESSWLWPLDMTVPARTETVISDSRWLLNQLEIGRGEGTHTWRRSAAKAISELHGLSAAQALLGHARITTTQLYTGNEEGYELLRKRLMGGSGFDSEMPSSNVVQIRQARTQAQVSENVVARSQ